MSWQFPAPRPLAGTAFSLRTIVVPTLHWRLYILLMRVRSRRFAQFSAIMPCSQAHSPLFASARVFGER